MQRVCTFCSMHPFFSYLLPEKMRLPRIEELRGSCESLSFSSSCSSSFSSSSSYSVSTRTTTTTTTTTRRARLARRLVHLLLFLLASIAMSCAALDRSSSTSTTTTTPRRMILAAAHGGRSWPPSHSSGRRRTQQPSRGWPFSYYSSCCHTVQRTTTTRSIGSSSSHSFHHLRNSSAKRSRRRGSGRTHAATIFPSAAVAAATATATTDPLRVNNNDSTAAASYNYDDLTWLGWGIAAAIELGFTVLTEYASGFVGGYCLGSLADIPRFLRKPMADTTTQQLHKSLFWKEFQGRALRSHAKAAQWGRTWAGISAAFGGIDVAVRVARRGKRDEWNTILSSVAAGAWFARKDGPQAMLRGALVYGGLMYLLSGNLRLGGPRPRPFEYEEKAIEF